MPGRATTDLARWHFGPLAGWQVGSSPCHGLALRGEARRRVHSPKAGTGGGGPTPGPGARSVRSAPPGRWWAEGVGAGEVQQALSAHNSEPALGRIEPEQWVALRQRLAAQVSVSAGPDAVGNASLKISDCPRAPARVGWVIS